MKTIFVILVAAVLVAPAAAAKQQQQQQYRLHLGVRGEGVVSAVPPGVRCADSCTVGVRAGAVVVLEAHPKRGYAFHGWGGACSGRDDVCRIKMRDSLTVTARFARRRSPAERAELTVSVGEGGSVVSRPSGINCPRLCAASFESGTAVALAARPERGYVFGGWRGACAGSESPCIVRLAGPKTVGAWFQRAPSERGNAERERAARAKAEREKAAREQAAREQAQREQEAREQADRERRGRTATGG